MTFIQGHTWLFSMSNAGLCQPYLEAGMSLQKKRESDALSLFCHSLSVREITTSSSSFSATNISSNIVWFLQLHDAMQMKSNCTWINYNHNNIAIRSHIIIYNFLWYLIFGTKFSSIYLAKWEKRLVFRLYFLTCSVRKMVLICLMQNIYIYVFIVSISSNTTLGIIPH